MTDDTTPAPRTRCPLWVKVLLTLSLAANLAIVAMVAGFLLRGPGPLRGGGPGLSYALPYIVALEKEDRRSVLRAVRDNPDLPDRRARRAHFDEMLTALQADPMDVDAVRTVLARQANGVAEVQAVAQAAWLERVRAMSPEDRSAYAARVEDVLRRGPRKRD